MMADRPPQGVDKYLDREVMSSDGHKLGIAAKLLKSRVDRVPEWIVVESGLLGRKRVIIPLAGSELADNHVTIPYTVELVHAQPHAEPDNETGTLSSDAEDALNAHFGLGANGHQ